MNEETKDPKQQAAEMSADKAEAAKATEAEEKNAEPADGTPDPKDQTISKQQEEIDELSNRLLRLQADFDNFRKRNTEERERLGRFVTASVVREFLKVLDNFERAEASVEIPTCLMTALIWSLKKVTGLVMMSSVTAR